MTQPVVQLDALLAVRRRLAEAQSKHRPFASLHEAYAVLLEEVDELWDEVRRRDVDHDRVRDEALDVAAVACRLLIELEAISQHTRERCSRPGG